MMKLMAMVGATLSAAVGLAGGVRLRQFTSTRRHAKSSVRYCEAWKKVSPARVADATALPPLVAVTGGVWGW